MDLILIRGDYLLNTNDLIVRTVRTIDNKVVVWVRATDESVAMMTAEHFRKMQGFNFFVKVKYKTMDRINVISSNIKSIGYDKAKMELEVVFKPKMTVYYYKNVPEDVWEGLKGATSVGSYFHRHIKDVFETVKG